MRTVIYNDVVRRVCDNARRNYETLSVEDAAVIRGFIEFHIRRVWNECPWPDLTRIEQRRFADDWSASVAYNLGSWVWGAADSKYYEAIAGVPAGTALSSAAHWRAGSPPVRKVALAQVGKTLIGDVLNCWSADPRVSTRASVVSYFLNGDDIQVREALDSIWIRFRDVVPDLTAAAVGDGAAYTLPHRLANIVVALAAGSLLRADGDDDAGTEWLGIGKGELERESGRVWEQQRQGATFEVVNG